MQKAARNATFTVLVISVVVTVSIIVRAADISTPLLILLLLGFTAWSMIPYLVLFYSTRVKTNSIVSWFILLSALAIGSLGIYVYIDAFMINLDPQSGLVFIFVPLYQLVLAWIVYTVAAVSNSRLRKPGTT